MFNIYQNDRRLALERSDSLEKLKRAKQALKCKAKHTKLKIRYDKRVKKFINEMLTSPTKADCSPPKAKPRLNGSFVINNFKNQKDRIKHEVAQQKLLDTSYVPRQVEFRQRAKEKEIQSSMFFKPRNNPHKISDKGLWKTTCPVPESSSINPDLKKKTYFKAVNSILVKPDIKRNRSSSVVYNPIVGNLSNQGICYYSAAKKVLQKCKYIH